MIEYGKILMHTYLPKSLLPADLDELSFDDFFHYYAMAEIVREMKEQDIMVGTNKGYVASFQDS